MNRGPSDTRSPFTVRAVGLGLLLVAVLSAYAPYQHVIGGAGFEGTYMPLVGVIAIGLVAVINALLFRFAPHRRFTPAENGVILAMLLAACGVIGIGLFRQLPGNLVGLWSVAPENQDWLRVMNELRLPEWMFPTMEGANAAEKGASEVVRGFVGRIPLDDRSFWSQWYAVPWGAWVAPAVAWGAFAGCLWGACLGLVLIFRKQWVENERLPFPIAQVYLSLIESPEPGFAFNRTLRARSLWVGAGVVFLYSLLVGMHRYDPTHFPEITRGYDFRTMFSEAPWSYTDWGLKQQESISFTLVAVCLFVTTKVSFSLWFFFILVQGVRMYLGAGFQREITEGMAGDQTLGAYLAYGLVAVFIARHHLGMVMRHMIGRASTGEAAGRYVSYAVAGWAVVAFTAGMSYWLHRAGCTVLGAVFLSVWILFCLTVLARLVAETGLAFLVYTLTGHRWFIYAAQDLPQRLAFRTSMETFFHSNLQSGIWLQDLGHSFSPHAATALRITDSAAFERENSPRRTWPLVLWMAVAIGVGYVVAGAGFLHMQYNHAVTLDKSAAVINDWGTVGMPRWHVLSRSAEFLPPRNGPAESHDRLSHFALGAGVTAVCSYLRLRTDLWPLHPVGFILVYGWGMNRMWLSLFIGWLVKVLVVRFGGSRMLVNVRPFFLGLIIGEAAGEILWVGVSLVRLGMGLEYYSVSM